MEIKYECTLEDYKEAMYSHIRPVKGSTIAAACGAIVLGIGLSAVDKNGFSVPAILAITGGLFGIFSLALRLFQKHWVERDFRRHPRFSGSARLFVNVDGTHS